MRANQEIELKTAEMQETLDSTPNYLLRSGSTIIAIFCIMLLAISYFIHYPDIISAPIRITTEHMPVELKAETDGSIVHFFSSDKQEVSAHDAVAVLNSSAKWQDVLYISQMLDSLDYKYPTQFQTEKLELGELQNAYNLFATYYQDYTDYQSQLFDKKKKEMIVKEISIQKNIKQFAKKQMSCLQQELESYKETFRKDSLLFLQKHLSYDDLENVRMNCVRCIQSIENQKHNIANIDLQIIQLQSDLLVLEKNAMEKSNQYYSNFRNSAESLKSEIKKWKQKYMITTPISGTICFTEFEQENQHIKQGEIFATILPTEKTEVVGKIELAAQGAGKVHEGQQAYIKLAQFPYKEYGSIPVHIHKICLAPVRREGWSYYLLEVQIPFPINTDFGKTIPYMQEMEGTIEIVTQDKRLIEKIIQPIQILFCQQKHENG